MRIKTLFILTILATLAISRTGAQEDRALVGRVAPELSGGEWINAKPLTLSKLRGKPVLLEFWTYGCINCLHTIPTVNEWARIFGNKLVIIGVHTPEFDHEKVLSNVRSNVKKLNITYPVVTDNDYSTWDAYHQRYWPAMYIIDQKGIIRHVHIGEGDYRATERIIQSIINQGEN